MAWIDSTFRAVVAESQHAVFESAHAVETPLGVDDGLGALAFGESFGGETGDELVREPSVSVEVLGGQDDDAGSEAVAQSVQAGGPLTGFGARPRRVLRVATIGFQLDDV